MGYIYVYIYIFQSFLLDLDATPLWWPARLRLGHDDLKHPIIDVGLDAVWFDCFRKGQGSGEIAMHPLSFLTQFLASSTLFILVLLSFDDQSPNTELDVLHVDPRHLSMTDLVLQSVSLMSTQWVSIATQMLSSSPVVVHGPVSSGGVVSSHPPPILCLISLSICRCIWLVSE